MGMAFQIVDDLLDYASCENATGKPNWTDFSEGCPTLPLILIWDSLEPEDKESFEVAFGKSPELFERNVLETRMKGLGAFELAEQAAKEFVRSEEHTSE